MENIYIRSKKSEFIFTAKAQDGESDRTIEENLYTTTELHCDVKKIFFFFVRSQVIWVSFSYMYVEDHHHRHHPTKMGRWYVKLTFILSRPISVSGGFFSRTQMSQMGHRLRHFATSSRGGRRW